MTSVSDVVAKLSEALYGQPLVTNIFRGQLVEAMVAIAVEPKWIWCSQDYNSWDFEDHSGIRLEVKQSAARQTWDAPKHGRVTARFDIRPRQFHWEGKVRIDTVGRCADIYVFAYHERIDRMADHRDPEQWKFFVVSESRLPQAKTISLTKLADLSKPTPYFALANEINKTKRSVVCERN